MSYGNFPNTNGLKLRIHTIWLLKRAKRFFQKCQNNLETFDNFRPFLLGKWPYRIIAKLDNYKKCNFWNLKKKNLGPVHLHPKTDKWDYLQSPIMKKNFVSCFDREVPRSPGKWNWNWLYFLPFIFTFEQGEMGRNRTK